MTEQTKSPAHMASQFALDFNMSRKFRPHTLDPNPGANLIKQHFLVIPTGQMVSGLLPTLSCTSFISISYRGEHR